MLQRFAIVLGLLAAAVSLSLDARAQPAPNYVTWYDTASPWPTPITSAYVGLGGALGAGNIYNTATNGFGTPGTGVLGTNECAFLCFGAPGTASSNVLAVGNDVSSPNPYSFTTIGAPDDCSSTRPCPGGIGDQIFSIEGYAAPTATPTVFIAIDSNANVGVAGNLYAGAAVIAGAGTGNPVPSPSPGSLVSYAGTGRGQILLGSAADNVRCDYGVANPGALTCNKPLIISSGGVRPNGAEGGYAPETFPLGVATTHPQILTGECSITHPHSPCAFPSPFFSDTTYNCVITAEGTTAIASSYEKTSSTTITIHTATDATFSYTCIR